MGSSYKINLGNIESNIAFFRQKLKCKICSVVKADAYGNGLVKVAKYIENNIDMFAVANVSECAKLKRAGIKKNILIMGSVTERLVFGENIIYSVGDTNDIETLKKYNKNVKIYIKINTGMNRYGINDLQSFDEIIERCKDSAIQIVGVYSHLANSQSRSMTSLQLKKFRAFYDYASVRYQSLCWSILSSGGAENVINGKIDLSNVYDMVRLGINQYCASFEGAKNVKSLESNIVELRNVKKGDSIGYGKRICKRDCAVAVVPLGYADGLDKRLSERWRVLVRDTYCKVIGSICMDCFFVDVSGVDCKKGDVVIVIGEQNNDISLMAKKIGGCKYELSTKLCSYRVGRKYINAKI